MKISNISNIISNPNTLAPAVFTTFSTIKMGTDYVKAPQERKNRTLIKDAGILMGLIGGFKAISPVTKKLCDSAKIKGHIIKDTEYIFKQAVAATINTFVGILGAVYANELTHKYILNKPFLNKKIENTSPTNSTKTNAQQNDILKRLNINEHNQKTIKTTVTNLTDLPSMEVFSTPMVAMTSFSIANTQGYHNKLKKMTLEILANTLIPTIFVSTVSLFVHNKKNIIKIPSLIGSVLAGTIIGQTTTNKYKNQISEKIDDLDLKYVALK